MAWVLILNWHFLPPLRGALRPLGPAEGAASCPLVGSGAPLAPRCPWRLLGAHIFWISQHPLGLAPLFVWICPKLSFSGKATWCPVIHVFRRRSFVCAILPHEEVEKQCLISSPSNHPPDIFFFRTFTLTYKLEFQTAEYSLWTPRVN